MDSAHQFQVEAAADGEATDLVVNGAGGEARRYRISGGEQPDYAAFFAELAGDFGTRVPAALEAPRAAPGDIGWKPLIVDNRSERTHAGYGDPAVIKVEDG